MNPSDSEKSKESAVARIAWMAIGAIVPAIAGSALTYLVVVTQALGSWFRGDITINTNKFETVDGQTVPDSNGAKFCALTQVNILQPGGLCRVFRDKDGWKMQSTATRLQVCEVTCWR